MLHLLHLSQVSENKNLTEVWTDLESPLKERYLMVLQYAIDLSARSLEVHELTVTTSSILNMVLYLELILYHREYLTTSLHQFVMAQNMDVVQKYLQANQHQVMAVGEGKTSLADSITL